MEERAKTVEIRLADLWVILKRYWWLMLAVLVLVFSVSFIFAKATYEEEYTATAIVWALGSNANTSSTGGQTSTHDVTIATALINDYKVLILTDSVLQEVIDAEGLQMKPAELRRMIDVSQEPDTRVMEISVTAGDPKGAKETVDRLTDVFCARINAKNANDEGEIEKGKELVTHFSYAPLPEKPSNHVSLLKLVLISVACAAAVYLIYVIRYLVDDKISTAEDVEKYLGVSLLGIVPNRQDVMKRRRSKINYYGYDGDIAKTATMQSSNQGGKNEND